MAFGSAPSEASPLLIRRDDELDALRAALADAVDGRGGFVLLVGRAGIGKTRLVEALVPLAESTGAQCRWGRCWEGGATPAYWPWRQVIGASVADTDTSILSRQLGHRAPEVAMFAPELRQRLPGLSASPPSQSADSRVRLFDGAIRYLLAAAEDTPMVIALDDLHAADEPSLRLLLRFVPEVPTSRLLVIGTYRDDDGEASHRTRRLLSDLGQHGRVMSLGGLGEQGVAELLGRATERVLPARFIRRVHEVTDGNPFLALEVWRHVQAQPVLDDVALPEELQVLVRQRLGGLDGPTRTLLSRAAVLGREFELTTLRALDTRSVTVLIDDLQRAEHAGIVREVGLGRWAFGHALYREAMYDDLTPAQRVTLHRRSGEAVEEQDRDDAAIAAELAHHYFASASVDGGVKAVHYCSRAGDMAMTSLAFEEAALHYDRALTALSLAPPVDERRRYELSVALGEARFRAGHLPEARQAYGAALRAARALTAPELLAHAALGYAGMYESAQLVDEATAAVLEEALAALPDDDSPVRARLLVAVAGRHQARAIPWEVSGPVSRQGLAMARRVGDPSTVQAVLWEWHRNAFFVPETLEERLEVADELVELATREHNQEWLIWALEWRAADHFERGDVPRAVSDLEVAGREAEQLRLPFLIWGATYQKAAVALLEGSFADAEELASAALKVGERTEFVSVEMNYLGQLMAIRRQQGRFTELEELTRRHSEKFAWAPTDGRWVFRALVLAELGDYDEARTVFDRCADASLASFRARGLRVLSVLADVCWLLGDRVRAAAVHQALLPYAGHHVLDGIAAYSLGVTDRHLAQTAALLGRWEEAELHFQAAHRLHEQLGARVWAAHTQVNHAQMLLQRRGSGDESRARELLGAARETYQSLGISHVDRLAGTLLPAPAVSGRAERGVWFLDGEHWSIEYAGRVVRLRDSKGLRYLTHLIRNPNKRFQALELASDDSAAGDAEQARHAVRRALRTSIDRLANAHPALGEHLNATVRSGVNSSYSPDPRAPVHWEAEPDARARRQLDSTVMRE